MPCALDNVGLINRGIRDMSFTHLDASGQAHMVDVTEKVVTQRTARAQGRVWMSEQVVALIAAGGHKKGDVLAVARIAGIQAAKKTADLIPLCHPLLLTRIRVELTLDQVQQCVLIEAECGLAGQTGVEMEALTAVSVAALTLYDMCKSQDKQMRIGDIRLLEKQGGRSGHWQADD